MKLKKLITDFSNEKADFQLYNADYSEPFGEDTYDDTIRSSTKNINNPYTAPIPGNPNRILSEHVRLSTADMKTHVNNNVLVVGGCGSGKTVEFVLPNILQMNGSYVVVDPGGHLSQKTKAVLEKNNYKVKIVNIEDYNPFWYLYGKDDIETMVDFLLTINEGKTDEIWSSATRVALESLISYLADFADKPYQNFKTLCWMINQDFLSEDGDSRLDDLFNGKIKLSHKEEDGQFTLEYVPVAEDKFEGLYFDKGLKNASCKKQYDVFVSMVSNEARKSILLSLSVLLSPFGQLDSKNIEGKNKLAFDSVGDELTALFIVTPTAANCNFLTSILVQQALDALDRRAKNEKQEKRFPYHVSFIMEEFPNVDGFPVSSIWKNLSIYSIRNISMIFIIQSIAQLKRIYKDDILWVGLCDTMILMNSIDPETTEFFSKMSELPEEEIAQLPDDKCMVIIRGKIVFLDKKYDIKCHPLFSEVE